MDFIKTKIINFSDIHFNNSKRLKPTTGDHGILMNLRSIYLSI